MTLPEIHYDEWFHDKPHPHDSMPIARDYDFIYDNPRPEEEIADNYASRHESTPKFENSAAKVVTDFRAVLARVGNNLNSV